MSNGSLAQLVEQRTLNPSVQGSNPCVPTISKNTVAFFCEHSVFLYLMPSLGKLLSLSVPPQALAKLLGNTSKDMIPLSLLLSESRYTLNILFLFALY